MGNRIGKEYRSDRARENAENLEHFFLNKGYRRADVRFIDAPYDPNTDTVRLRYRVTVGPRSAWKSRVLTVGRSAAGFHSGGMKAIRATSSNVRATGSSRSTSAADISSSP